MRGEKTYHCGTVYVERYQSPSQELYLRPIWSQRFRVGLLSVQGGLPVIQSSLMRIYVGLEGNLERRFRFYRQIPLRRHLDR